VVSLIPIAFIINGKTEYILFLLGGTKKKQKNTEKSSDNGINKSHVYHFRSNFHPRAKNV
jgi:hypothetical protein